MPRKSSGARQSSMSPDFTPMRSSGFFARKRLGVFAVKRGMNEPDVAEGVRAVGCVAIGVARSGRLAVGHAEGRADLELRIDGLDGAEGLTLRDVDDVGGAHAIDEILARRRMNAPRIAEKRKDPGLVENTPMGNA